MYIEQFFTDGLGCISYLIGCEAHDVAAVVDPDREVGKYLTAAAERSLKISQIIRRKEAENRLRRWANKVLRFSTLYSRPVFSHLMLKVMDVGREATSSWSSREQKLG